VYLWLILLLKYQWAIALAIVVPYVVDRRVSFQIMVANRPSQLPEFAAFKSHKIEYSDIVRNCEDVALDEDLGIAYFSCDPGRDRWNTVMVSE
jgi:arylesterase/paraoxonase